MSTEPRRRGPAVWALFVKTKWGHQGRPQVPCRDGPQAATQRIQSGLDVGQTWLCWEVLNPSEPPSLHQWNRGSNNSTYLRKLLRGCDEIMYADGRGRRQHGKLGGPPPEGSTPKPSAADANSKPFSSNSRVSSAMQSYGILGVFTTLCVNFSPVKWGWQSYLPYRLAAAAAAAATKSLQSCPTLCDPRDGSPPGSPIPGILQARTLEWVAISFSNAWKWKGLGGRLKMN